MKKIFSLVLSLTVISAVCAAVLSYISTVTKEPISKADINKKLAAAREVMPSDVSEVEAVAWEDAAHKRPVDFIGKNSSGVISGYACTGVSENGYGGKVVLMVGFEPDAETLVCYKPIKHAETPGLGSKLSSKEFASQFTGKKASSLKVVKDGGEIEAITSATITSRAVCEAIGNAKRKAAALK